jgi:hypothetical protein
MVLPQGKNPDVLKDECLQQFAALVEDIGIKRFSSSIGVSTRQVNRILSGAQPNPIERLIRCLQAVDPQTGDRVIDYICQELGGHFVRQEGLNDAAVNAVRECAEAIAAISDGEITTVDMKEIREAINALSSLIYALREARSRNQHAGRAGA